MSIRLESNEVTGASSTAEVGITRYVKCLRVLHVVPRLGMGGTENGVLKIIEGLGDQDFEHRICAVRGIDPDFGRDIKKSIKTCSAGAAEPGFQFPLFRLAKVMKEFRPHIVHTRNFGALEGIAAARLVRVPVVIHSEHGYELEILGGLPMRRRLMCWTLYSFADCVFTVTRDLQKYHAKQSWLCPDRFRLFYNGVDTSRFFPSREGSSALRTRLGIPAERVIIGSVGRLVPIKDYGTLLRAAETLISKGKDIHVLIVGTGPQFEQLREQTAASKLLRGRVTLPGSSNQIPEFLNAMDLFVLSSVSEGMSNTLLEAMSSGLPVVVTDTGGNAELVTDQESGCLFPVGDILRLAEILDVLVDEREERGRLGNAARRRVMKYFSFTSMLDRYRNLYLELASHAFAGESD